MASRKIRRAAAHKARKAARKAGFPVINTSPESIAPSMPSLTEAELAAIIDQPPTTTTLENIIEPAANPASQPEPWRVHLSAAKLAANKANAMLSHGALTAETKAICSQNHTKHGLARHQPGHFKILTTENAADFEALQKSLIAEHEPSTETEAILVNRMAESHWLGNRAQGLQDTLINPDTGEVTDEKKFNLYMRYQTTHTRSFTKCLNDLLKLRSERRKAEVGVEAQRIETEKHELKKQVHHWEVMRKDAAACRELSALVNENFVRAQSNPEFSAQYNAELAKRGLESNVFVGATQAA